MRREVEVKAKISDIDAVVKNIEKLGCIFADPIIQNDVTFVDQEYGPYEEFQPGKNILRIRESSGKYTFTLKNPKLNQLDAIEFETEISNPHSFEKCLELMGYHRVVEIHKERRKTNYQNLEICIDRVVGLGDFIEVEEITEGEVEGIQEKLFEFIQSFGIKKEDQIWDGYDTQIYLKQKIKHQTS